MKSPSRSYSVSTAHTASTGAGTSTLALMLRLLSSRASTEMSTAGAARRRRAIRPAAAASDAPQAQTHSAVVVGRWEVGNPLSRLRLHAPLSQGAAGAAAVRVRRRVGDRHAECKAGRGLDDRLAWDSEPPCVRAAGPAPIAACDSGQVTLEGFG